MGYSLSILRLRKGCQTFGLNPRSAKRTQRHVLPVVRTRPAFRLSAWKTPTPTATGPRSRAFWPLRGRWCRRHAQQLGQLLAATSLTLGLFIPCNEQLLLAMALLTNEFIEWHGGTFWGAVGSRLSARNNLTSGPYLADSLCSANLTIRGGVEFRSRRSAAACPQDCSTWRRSLRRRLPSVGFL